MPKTIDLPELPITEEIELDTGQMTAIAVNAIKREVQPRKWWQLWKRQKKQRRKRRMKPVILMHGRVIVQARGLVRPLLNERMLERAALWEDHYNQVARARR